MQRHLLAAAALSASLFLAACGGSAAVDTTGDTVAAPSAGMCAPDMPDCVDTVGSPDGSDASDGDAARDTARDLLGREEADLEPEVRIGRRGDEHMMLTEDYVVGRMTVEMDADADGIFRVTAVIVELPDGPETISG